MLGKGLGRYISLFSCLPHPHVLFLRAEPFLKSLCQQNREMVMTIPTCYIEKTFIHLTSRAKERFVSFLGSICQGIKLRQQQVVQLLYHTEAYQITEDLSVPDGFKLTLANKCFIPVAHAPSGELRLLTTNKTVNGKRKFRCSALIGLLKLLAHPV